MSAKVWQEVDGRALHPSWTSAKSSPAGARLGITPSKDFRYLLLAADGAVDYGTVDMIWRVVPILQET